MISAREPTALRDDIWMRTETGYDMKNVMLWSLYHILQNSFPEIHDVACNKLTNIDRKAYYNILEAFNKLALSAHLGHSCETGWIKHDSSYYSKQNSKVLPQGKILAMLSTSIW
jgi:hypothetical protein